MDITGKADLDDVIRELGRIEKHLGRLVEVQALAAVVGTQPRQVNCFECCTLATVYGPEPGGGANTNYWCDEHARSRGVDPKTDLGFAPVIRNLRRLAGLA